LARRNPPLIIHNIALILIFIPNGFCSKTVASSKFLPLHKTAMLSCVNRLIIANSVGVLGNTMTNIKDFFISYNSADKDRAEWIAWQLEEAGYTAIIQAWDFGPGQNFVLAMQKAATEAKRTIAVLSPNYLNAKFTAPEWAAAFVQDPTGEQRLLIPVRVEPVELTGLLKPIVYIDLVGITEKSEARDILLKGISGTAFS
jgi:hypothetical protein